MASILIGGVVAPHDPEWCFWEVAAYEVSSPLVAAPLTSRLDRVRGQHDAGYMDARLAAHIVRYAGII